MNNTAPAVPDTFAPPAVPMGEGNHVTISAAIRQSQQAFTAALPALLASKTPAQKWVAFHGSQLVTFGGTKTEVHQECLRKGLNPGTFVVRRVQPESPLEAEVTSAP
jgi:hypothetical protein